jgi:hypothetical protein
MSPAAGYHRLLDAVQLTTAEFNTRWVQTYISLPQHPGPAQGSTQPPAQVTWGLWCVQLTSRSNPVSKFVE